VISVYFSNIGKWNWYGIREKIYRFSL